MYRNHKILAIVPARSGSTRIPDKNMQKIGGVSLIGWAGLCLRALDWIDKKIISSDSIEYLREGDKYDLNVRKRPDRFSTNDSNIIDLINYMRAQWIDFDILLLIEPSSPMRTPEDIQQCVDMLIDNATVVDLVFTVSPVPYKCRPHRLIYIDEKQAFINGDYTPYLDYYYRNGLCYAYKVKYPLELLPSNNIPIIIDRPIIDIDEPEELLLAEQLILRGADWVKE